MASILLSSTKMMIRVIRIIGKVITRRINVKASVSNLPVVMCVAKRP